MEQLRFRAWDKIQKRFLYMNIRKGFMGIEYTGEKPFSDLQEWQQFTGLRDSKGVDIFEGDILTDKIVVKWRADLASFALDKYGWMHDHYFGEGVDAEKIEIIGNIYEHPELLK